MIRQAYLKQLLSYSTETGLWLWLEGGRRGREAGYIDNGRRIIKIRGQKYYADKLKSLYLGEVEEVEGQGEGQKDGSRMTRPANGAPSFTVEEEQQLMQLRDGDKKIYKEIAKILNKSESQVKGRYWMLTRRAQDAKERAERASQSQVQESQSDPLPEIPKDPSSE